jgi:hypothetical protein
MPSACSRGEFGIIHKIERDIIEQSFLLIFQNLTSMQHFNQ